MEFLNSIVNAPSSLIGIFIFLAILLMAFIRYKDNKAILSKYPREEIRLMTYGVNFFGQESKEKKPLRSSGGLVLVSDGLYYHARFGAREFFIPGKTIRSVGTTDTFCEKNLHQKVIVINFTNDSGDKDRAAYRIPNPASWVQAIKMTQLSN